MIEGMRRAFWLARREKGALSTLVVVVENAKALGAALGERAPEQARNAVAGWLLEGLEGPEVHGFAEGDRIVLFLPGTPVPGAEALARHVIAHGRKRGIVVDEQAAPVRISAGVADGTEPVVRYVETLVEVALEGALVAASGGGNRCVHTEVYDIVQVRLDRELPDEAKRVPPLEKIVIREAETPSSSLPSPEKNGEAPSASPFDLALPDEVVREVESQLSQAVAASHDIPARRMLVDLAVSHARREWEEASSRLTTKHSREMELLERRIAKLSEALEGARERLEEVERSGASDAGTSSAFRSVQGLSRQEENYELKRELMGMIFKANLELYRELGRT